MKKYLLVPSFLLLLVSCDENVIPSRDCSDEYFKKMYNEAYIPWVEMKCEHELLDCKEWSIFIYEYYREQGPTSYIESYDIYDYFYDHGPEALFEEIFMPSWCLDNSRGFCVY